MPWSSWNGKEYTKAIMAALAPQSALDVGAGAGTYRDLVYCPDIEAIEVWAPYIERFGLRTAYTQVYNMRVQDFEWLGHYDLVILGDVLEHMSKPEAQAVMAQALLHANYVLVSIPIVRYEQGEWEGNPYEVHIKPDWSHAEIMDTWGTWVAACNCHGDIGVYLLTATHTTEVRAAHLAVTASNPQFRAMDPAA